MLRRYRGDDYEMGAVMSRYDDVLVPFKRLMETELHANAAKGDRPGWLSMTAEQCLLEIYYHVSKLQKAARDGNGDRIKENTADVANMAMMLADICGALEMAQPSDGALTNEGAEPVAQYTYASKQETNCAGCSLRKHTPLRIDDMGGYVCLTCIDKQLDAFFASPAQASVILPPAPELPEEPLFADDDSHMDAYHAACRMRNACAKAIAAAGVGLRLEP